MFISLLCELYSTVTMKFIVAFLAVLAVGSVSATPLLGDLGGVVGKVTGIVGNLSSTLNGLLNNLQDAINKVLGSVESLLPQLIAAVTSVLNQIVASIQGHTALEGLGLTGVLTDLVNNVQFCLEDVIGEVECILGSLPDTIDDLVASLDVLLNQLLCTVQDLIQTVVAAVAELLNKVSKAVDEALAQLQVALKSVIQVVSDTLACLVEKLNDSPVGSALNGLLEQVSVIVAELVCALTKVADDLVANVRVALRKLSAELQKILASLAASLGNLGLQCPT